MQNRLYAKYNMLYIKTSTIFISTRLRIQKFAAKSLETNNQSSRSRIINGYFLVILVISDMKSIVIIKTLQLILTR